MSAALRRPIVAVALVAVIIGGWLGLAPRDVAPAEPAAAVVPTGPPPSAASGPPASPTPDPGPVTPTPTEPAILPVPQAASATADLTATLDARLEHLRARSGIPGISVAIVFADGSVWRGDAGLADVAAGTPVTSDTAFSIASVSKTFTAALILALVEDGRLGLDTRARTIVPSVGIDPTITVRQLLDHTSGLRDFYFGPRIDKALLSKPGQVWDAKRSLTYVGKPFSKPGAAFHYSNTNYLVLGLIAEAAGRAPMATQLRDRFFVPLGLDHTWYQASDAPAGPIARGYRFTGADPLLPAISLSDGSDVAPFTSVVTASGAAGSIASSAVDLAHWAAALYGGDVLDRASRDAMLGDVVRTGKGALASDYGLGVQEVNVDRHLTYGHSGRFLGARAAVRWLPGERVSIAVTTNQSRTDPNAILADLLKVVFPPPPPIQPAMPDCGACAPVQ